MLLDAALRVALRALPEPIRSRVGPDITALTLRRVGEARGIVRSAAVAVACLADIVRRGLYERLRPTRGPNAAPTHSTIPREDPVDALLSDLRHATRALARTPRFSLAVVLVLSLGIGANSAIFSVVHSVMLQPLPFPEADRFAHVGIDYGRPAAYMPYFRVDHLRRNTEAFEAVASYRGHGGRVVVDGRFDRVSGLRVDGPFLDAVGYPVALGRWFTDEELAPDGPPAVIVTEETWRTRFSADRDVLGRGFDVGERTYTVVGVLPSGFAFPQVSGEIEYLVPLGIRPSPDDQGQNYTAIARLADGVDAAEAEADLARAWAILGEEHPDFVYERENGYTLSTFDELYVGGSARTTLWMLLGAVGVVLIIACANVANLLLARAAQRRREVALRAALGATPARIVRYVLTESLVLAGVSAALGVVLAGWAAGLLVQAAPFDLPRADAVGIDGSMLAFTLAWTLLTGLVFGSAAALPVLRNDLDGLLRNGGRTTAGGGRARQGLILAQSGLSMVLLVGAGLLLGTVWQLRSVDAGFETDGLLTARMPVLPPGYSGSEEMAELARRLVEGLTLDPRVRGAAATARLPLERGMNIPITIAGRPDDSEGATEWRAVTPGYFELLEIDLRLGRAFAHDDRAGTAPVAVVNQSFADRWFAGESPLGREFLVGAYRGEFFHPALAEVGPVRIVGVVADVRDRSLKEVDARRTIYVPFAQVPDPLTHEPTLLVDAPRASDGARAIRSAVADVDARFGPPDVGSMADVVAASLAAERFNAFLIASFAALALLMTAFGIYGVVSYTVSLRTRDIGLRMALGAERGSLLRSVVAGSMRPVFVGVALGLGASLWLGRLVQDLVWGVQPNDPATLMAVAAGLLVVAVLATWFPARAATRIDPVRALGAD